MEIALSATTSSRIPAEATVLIPVGSTEQHGPYIPLDTDTEIAVAVADLAAKMLRRRRLQVVVAPPFAYGASAAHEPSPGTVSIDPDLLRMTLVSLVRSASTWGQRFVIVDAGHGNLSAVQAAMADLTDQSYDIQGSSCVSIISGPYVGRIETSLMLHLRPREVRSARATRARKTAGAARVVAASGKAPASATDPILEGVLLASEDEGRELLDQLARFVARDVLERVGGLVF